VAGVRWFGRTQVAMCALLGLSLVVLIVPGLPAIRPPNYSPFFAHGFSGFMAALPPLFFAYAGFESLAQTAGEVKDSTRRLPGIFLKGIAATTAIYLLMSAVAFGVLPGPRLGASAAPMTEVAAQYLPVGATWFVTLGAVMALTTSLNTTMLVPSRLGIMLAADGLAPRWLGAVHPRTGTPVRGLTLSLLAASALLVSGQVSLALNIAVLALVVLYFIHSLALLLLPRMNPPLFRTITAAMPVSVQRAAAVVSMLAMGALVVVQVAADVGVLRATTLAERVAGHSLTTVELSLLWALIGAGTYVLGRARRPTS
jgi:amino acid transporter